MLFFATSSVWGAAIRWHVVADAGSRFVSHSFDGLFELGRTRASTRVEEPDGAFLYSELPDYLPLGGGGTAFPNKSNFLDLGTIGYDDATGQITDLQADFAKHVAPGRFTFYQGVSGAPAYTTSFDSFSGSVSFAESGMPVVNPSSQVVFSIDGSAVGDGTLTYTGSLDVVDSKFSLAVHDTGFSHAFATGFGDGDIQLEWDVSGAIGIVGDFNQDGSVDAADYTTWRDHLGSGHSLGGAGDEIGVRQHRPR
ncbi:hypothetical protein KOR34_15090 [Posidoniimonas corsicana]|uniref:Uncharacterized protein n=1 Tax=Posidoniimonas corsicana TaxID=1938618 RepID=A0A5C5VF00_9BACT|nr:hypothetical protein [Posidoniimonas corsicana]TWT36603.1 hypothetical protein KOR34_15090 [Posidoniimonas corsicana]